MRIRWRGLELPHRVVAVEQTLTQTYGKFVIEPFERGFGTTVGNSLRRILLSSLEGASVTGVKIKGAPHEFTCLEGVTEDVTDIILNVKNMVVSLEGGETRTMRLQAEGPGEVTADLIEADTSVTIHSPESVLATLTKQVDFDMEFIVEKGRGYVPASEQYNNPGEEIEIGLIPVDAIFSPVTRVRYKVEDTRVGQKTNYDKLTLEVWTNGTITPEMAMVEAAKILRKHLNPFIHCFELGKELKPEFGDQAVVADLDIEESGEDSASREALAQMFLLSTTDLDLSVRAANCLESENIRTIGELCRLKESDLVKLRNFGRVTLKEIEKKLGERGLRLGMEEVDSILASR